MMTYHDWKYGTQEIPDFSNITTTTTTESMNYMLEDVEQKTVIQKKKTFTPTHKKRDEFGKKR